MQPYPWHLLSHLPPSLADLPLHTEHLHQTPPHNTGSYQTNLGRSGHDLWSLICQTDRLILYFLQSQSKLDMIPLLPLLKELLLLTQTFTIPHPCPGDLPLPLPLPYSL